MRWMLMKIPRRDETAPKPRTAAFVALCMLLLGSSFVQASKKVRSPTHAELSQVWVGISEDELYLMRISLSPDGQGYGAYSFLAQEPRAFRISSWVYRPPSLRFTIESVDGRPLAMNSLRGSVVGSSMQLSMEGQGWSRSLSLRSEADLEGRWIRLKEIMRPGRSGAK
jgi:hypothetical protein